MDKVHKGRPQRFRPKEQVSREDHRGSQTSHDKSAWAGQYGGGIVKVQVLQKWYGEQLISHCRPSRTLLTIPTKMNIGVTRSQVRLPLGLARPLPGSDLTHIWLFSGGFAARVEWTIGAKCHESHPSLAKGNIAVTGA